MAHEKDPPSATSGDVDDVHYNLGGTLYTCNVGMGILGKYRFTIGGNEITIELEDGRKKTWKKKGSRNPWLEFDVSDEDLKNVESVDFVASTGFDGDLTVDRETATRLGLQEIPGHAVLASIWSPGQWLIKCTKAMARIRVPELDLDMVVVAAVMPFDGPTFTGRS